MVANFAPDVGYAWWLMENFWVQIAQAFLASGAHSFLIYPAIAGIPQSIAQAPIHVIKHDFSDRSRLGRKKLKTIITENSIKNIYLTDREYFSLYYAQLRKWGIKRIILHDHSPGERSPVSKWKFYLKRSIHTLTPFSCDYYIGVSQFICNRFARVAGIPSGRCFYVHNGIEPICVDEKRDYYTHDQFNIPRKASIIVSTGRATFYKNVDFLIRSADILVNKRDRQNVYFLYCGAGPDMATFQRIVHGFNLTDKFIFAGKRDDIRQILPSCDIAFHASHGEAFSLAILEYLSAGLATVVPNNCGNGEAIQDGVNGCLYEPGDLASAVDILCGLLDDKKSRAKLGAEATRSVEEKFALAKTNTQLMDLLSSLLC